MESILGLTREERVERLKKDIDELGVLDMHFDSFGQPQNDQLEAMESVIKILREEDITHPPEYYVAVQKFILSVRDEVWKWDPHLQNVYFSTSENAIWTLKEHGLSADDCLSILKEVFDPERFFHAYERGR